MRYILVLAILLSAFAVFAVEPMRINLPQGDGLCGVWRMQPDGAMIAISHGVGRGEYRITIIDSPDYNIAAGEFAGMIRPTAAANTFDVEMFTKPGNPSSRKHNFIAEFKQGSLLMTPYRASASWSLARLLPYLFRLGYQRANRPTGIDGAVRIYPTPSDAPIML